MFVLVVGLKRHVFPKDQGEAAPLQGEWGPHDRSHECGSPRIGDRLGRRWGTTRPSQFLPGLRPLNLQNKKGKEP